MKRRYTDPAKFGQDFAKWASRFPGKVLDAAFNEIGAVVVRDARRYSPVGVHRRAHRAGNLRQSIAWEVRNGRLAVGSDVEYAPFIEFGTRHIRVGTAQRPRQTWPAKRASNTASPETMPFLRPAIWRNRRRIIKTLKTSLKKGR